MSSCFGKLGFRGIGEGETNITRHKSKLNHKKKVLFRRHLTELNLVLGGKKD
jgi:hypothetical protein